MSGRVRDHSRVLADTTVFCNFLRVLDDASLIALLDYLDDAVRIVLDVNREMNGLSRHPQFAGFGTLKTVAMVGQYLRDRPVPLPPDMAAQVEQIVEHGGIFTRNPAKEKQDWGEIATVLMAAKSGAAVLTDDRGGRRLANRRGVTRYGTRDLVVQMCLDGAMPSDDAYEVWRIAETAPQSREAFDAVLAAGGAN